MLDMATVQNSGTVPNILDIHFEDSDKNTDKTGCTLGNFRGEIQIKGKYNMNKFVEDILKNEDKPLVLCMQFNDPRKKKLRYIYLQTSYKMCPPLRFKDDNLNSLADENRSFTKVNSQPNDDISSYRTKKDKTQEFNQNESQQSKFTLCEQLQNLLFPCQRRHNTGELLRKNKTTTAKGIPKEGNIGDGKHVHSIKKGKGREGDSKKDSKLKSKKIRNETSETETDGRRPRREKIRKEIAEIEIDGRRFGAILISDPNEEIEGRKIVESDKGQTEEERKSRSRRWLLEEGAEDLDYKKWSIPHWVRKDTICRCNSYFPDGKCKCHEYLTKIGVKELGPLYVPQEGEYPYGCLSKLKQNAQDQSRHGELHQTQSKTKLDDQVSRKNNTEGYDNQQPRKESGDETDQLKQANKTKQHAKFASSGDQLNKNTYEHSDGKKESVNPLSRSYSNAEGLKIDPEGKVTSQKGKKCTCPPNKCPKKQKKLSQKTNQKQLTGVPVCKCQRTKDPMMGRAGIPSQPSEAGKIPSQPSEAGKESYQIRKPLDPEKRTEYPKQVIPCVSKGIIKMDGKNYTAEFIICDKDGDVAKRYSRSKEREFRKISKQLIAEMKREELEKKKLKQTSRYEDQIPSQTGSGIQLQQTPYEKETFQSSGEIVIVPSKASQLQTTDESEERISDRFYCGCTGYWIEYYPKKSRTTATRTRTRTTTKRTRTGTGTTTTRTRTTR